MECIHILCCVVLCTVLPIILPFFNHAFSTFSWSQMECFIFLLHIGSICVNFGSAQKTWGKEVSCHSWSINCATQQSTPPIFASLFLSLKQSGPDCLKKKIYMKKHRIRSISGLVWYVNLWILLGFLIV